MMTNLDKQADEILALQAIFETNFHQLDKRQYELSVDFDLITPTTIECEDQTSIIEYLPPLTLIIHYHDDYPSELPPSFLLSCFYLSKSDLRQLCQELDKHPFATGEVCVYEWVDIIRLAMPHQLTFDRKLDESDDSDPRALNGYSNENAKRVFQQLIDYNSQQFHQRIQTCLICKNSLPGIDCIRLHRCRHLYCRACLKNLIRTTLGKGQVGDGMRCPQQQCQEVLMSIEVKQSLNDQRLYDQYERLTVQRRLESQPQPPHSYVNQQQTSNRTITQRRREQTVVTRPPVEQKDRVTQIHQRIVIGYGHIPTNTVFYQYKLL